jgi:hypothetical protein
MQRSMTNMYIPQSNYYKYIQGIISWKENKIKEITQNKGKGKMLHPPYK